MHGAGRTFGAQSLIRVTSATAGASSLHLRMSDSLGRLDAWTAIRGLKWFRPETATAFSLAGRVRAADLNYLGAVIADVTRIIATFRLADALQRRRQAAAGDCGTEGLVAGVAVAATDAAATHTGRLSARPGSPFNVRPPQET